MKKLSIILFSLLAFASSFFAADFTVDGISYNITDATKRTVEVTKNSTGYSGSITIPSSVMYSSMTFSVTSIGEYAFQSSSITSITMPNSITTFGTYAFLGSSLESVIIPKNMTSIGSCAFYECRNLASVTIPNSVKKIGNSAFRGCSSLLAITIPDSVTKIESTAFYECTSLTNFTITKNVKSIGSSAFAGCTSITFITVECNTPPSLGTDAFKEVSHFIPVYVPCGKKDVYQAASGWSSFFNIQYADIFPYNIIVSSVNPTQGSAKVDIQPDCGTDAVISATASAGYTFAQWSDGNFDNPRSLTVTENISLTASFAPARCKLQLHSDSTKGVVSANKVLPYNTLQEITATSNEHYHFTQWSDGNTDNPRTITVVSDTILEAFFEINKYTLSLINNDTNVGILSGEGTYDACTDVWIMAACKSEGYIFSQWSDNNMISGRKIKMTNDTTLIAYFIHHPDTTPIHDTTIIEIHDTAYIEVHDTAYINMIEVNSMNPTMGSAILQVYAIPENGYQFMCWSDYNTSNPRIIEDSIEPRVYTAVFTNQTPTNIQEQMSNADPDNTKKYIRKNQLLIHHGGKIYNAQGVLVE